MAPNTESKSRRSALLFVLLQLVLAGAVSAAVIYRGQQLSQRDSLPPLREVALDVRPEFDYPVVVTDGQLVESLRKLRPRFFGAETSVGHIDHHLRCWGFQAKFAGDEFASGEQMRTFLTDHRSYAAMYGAEAPPLLIDVDGTGVRVREFEGSRSSPHDDHTMATLVEIGTPLDFPLILPGREGTAREMVEQSLIDFDLDQREYEWSVVTYCLLIDAPAWQTSEGRTVDFNMLAERIMRQEQPEGVCFGNHRLFALALLLRVDDQTSILSDSTRGEILAYLTGQTRILVQHQHVQGFWNGNWPTEQPANLEPTEIEGDRMRDRIIATGHALEWWSLAPEEVHPPRGTLAAAGQWVVHTIEGMSDDELAANASFLSHAGRALALWRGKFPHEVDLGSQR